VIAHEATIATCRSGQEVKRGLNELRAVVGSRNLNYLVAPVPPTSGFLLPRAGCQTRTPSNSQQGPAISESFTCSELSVVRA
jgi:hypothetical protein